MKLSQLPFLPEYFDRYINKCDDVELLEAIQTGIDELKNAPLERWKAIGEKTYAPGKWTIKDILQHLIDTERIFCFRTLSFARGDTQQMPFFTEDEFAERARANERTIESLTDELLSVHLATQTLYRSFTPEMLSKTGKSFKGGEYSVAAIGFMLPGHQRWHFDFIKEKYLAF